MSVLSAERKALGKIVESIVERFLKGKPHVTAGTHALSGLRTGAVAARKVGASMVVKLAKLFPEITSLAKTEAVRRAESRGFKRLFGKLLEDMRAHPERRKYHAVLSEMHAENVALRAKLSVKDLDKVTGANRALDPLAFELLEGTGQTLYHSLAGSIDSYADLAEETKAFNGIMKLLYPEKFLDEFRLDAQHIVEQRAFDKFKDMWLKLGWKSKSDLPAIPLHYRFHIRTPKDPEAFSALLSGPAKAGFTKIAEIAEKKDIVSLTDSLERAIPAKQLEGLKTPEEYIAKLIEFYTPSKIGKEKREIGVIGKDIVPVLKEIEKEIQRIRDLEKLAAKAGKAAKSK